MRDKEAKFEGFGQGDENWAFGFIQWEARECVKHKIFQNFQDGTGTWVMGGTDSKLLQSASDQLVPVPSWQISYIFFSSTILTFGHFQHNKDKGDLLESLKHIRFPKFD